MIDSFIKIPEDKVEYYNIVVDWKLGMCDKLIEQAKEKEAEFYAQPFYKIIFKPNPHLVYDARDKKYWWQTIKESISVGRSIYVDNYVYRDLIRAGVEYENSAN